MGLSASEYRIGLAVDSDVDIPYVSSFGSIISFAAKIVDNPALVEKAEERDAFKASVAYEKDLATSYRNERAIESAEPELIHSEYTSEVVPLDLSDSDLSFIASSDEAAISYIKYVNDLDELYFISVYEDEGLYEVSIYLDGLAVFRFLYSEYVESDAEIEILRYMILRYRMHPYTIAHVSGNTGADIFIDGEPSERYGDYIVMPFGMHHIEISSPSYENLSMDEMIGPDFSQLDYELTKVRTLPLFISTLPYTDDVYYQGEKVMGGYVDQTTYPFSIIVTKEGFESRTIQSDVGEHSVVTTLLPSALYYPERIEEKKGEFYTHLLITLLTYGASIAVDVVSDIYTLDLVPVSTLIKGVSVLELVRTFTALFEYRDALSYGI